MAVLAKTFHTVIAHLTANSSAFCYSVLLPSLFLLLAASRNASTYGHRSRFRHYVLTPPVPFG